MEAFALFWKSYLKDIFDVLISAYIFYRLLKLFKGTRAVQVVIGVLLLSVITFVTIYVFKFTVTGWLLGKFWSAGIIVFVIVFQPELRAAFAHLGSRSWGRIIIPEEISFIKEMMRFIRASVESSDGALIVLEQDTGLRNYIETGTVINGQVTKELMQSVFNNKSPLHDGAVIIQNTRLIAAGCLLPLSNNPSISKILGTRHRAAVGLTEISDAIVIVVSEETSMISISRNGKLEWGINPDKLYQFLVDHYKQRIKGGK